jgi:serine/threonine protein kinase
MNNIKKPEQPEQPKSLSKKQPKKINFYYGENYGLLAESIDLDEDNGVGYYENNGEEGLELQIRATSWTSNTKIYNLSNLPYKNYILRNMYIKMIHLSRYKNKVNQSLLRKFRNEVEYLIKTLDNKNTVRIHAAWINNKHKIAFIVLDKLAYGKSFRCGDPESYFSQLTSIVGILNENNIVHGDIQIGNIMKAIDSDTLVLIDFENAGPTNERNLEEQWKQIDNVLNELRDC